MQPVCEGLAESPSATAMVVTVPRPATEPRSLEELAYRYGRYYDSYLATEPGREAFWSHNGLGVVALARVGRYLQAGGGLLAPQGQREGLLMELIAAAGGRGDSLSFYNVTENDLPLFRRHAFQVTKLGEEAVINLDEWSCDGKAFEWLRRQVNYCRRQRLHVTECNRTHMPADEWARLIVEMAGVSAAFLAAKPQAAELRFLDGTFDPYRIGRRRIFVARAAEGAGRMEGFLICNPYLAGAGWAFEIYRQRPDAVRGTIPFLMHQAIAVLQQEHARRVSLCLVPGLHAAAPLPGDSALARRGLTLGSKYFTFIFDAAGLYHYKSRFRPRFESRYLCARPAVTLGAAWALVRLLGVLDLDHRKLGRVLGQRLRKWGRRITLAVPK